MNSNVICNKLQKEVSYIWQHMAMNIEALYILRNSLGVETSQVTHKLLNEKSLFISFAIHSIPNSLHELYIDLLTYISFLHYAHLIHPHTHTHTLSGVAN